MQAHSVITTTTRTVRVLSPTHVQDVLEMGVRTIPGGIFFLYDFPYFGWLAEGGAALAASAADAVAQDVESVASRLDVAGVSFIQDVDANGLLKNLLEVVVQVQGHSALQTGPLQATVEIDIETLGNPELARYTWQAQIEQAAQQLAATVY